MEVSEYIILGMIFLIFGCLLYIPGRLISKRKLANSESDSNLRLHISSSGYAWATLMVFTLILGSSQRYLAPQSELGKFVNTNIGLVSFWVIVAVLFIIFGYILEMIGFELFQKSSKDR